MTENGFPKLQLAVFCRIVATHSVKATRASYRKAKPTRQAQNSGGGHVPTCYINKPKSARCRTGDLEDEHSSLVEATVGDVATYTRSTAISQCRREETSLRNELPDSRSVRQR